MKTIFSVTIETDECDDFTTRERVAQGLALLAGQEPAVPKTCHDPVGLMVVRDGKHTQIRIENVQIGDVVKDVLRRAYA